MRYVIDIDHTHFMAWDPAISALNRGLDRVPIEEMVKRGEAIHWYHEIDENTIQVYLYVDEPLPGAFARIAGIRKVGDLKVPSGRVHVASGRIDEPKGLKGRVKVRPGSYRVDAC